MTLNSLSKDSELKIISNSLKIDMEKKVSTFVGDVYANNTDVKLWSQEMIVNLEKETDEIDEILAKGNIKMIILNRGSEIYGDNARYFVNDDSIIITGNVLVKENGNEITGEKLIVDLTNSSSIMESSASNRVEATIINN
tara:strand:+ start:540 stop:959 length:420 start_codon:yes stop_codon:yes gene_type:complete